MVFVIMVRIDFDRYNDSLSDNFEDSPVGVIRDL